jgi:hypothetical protein
VKKDYKMDIITNGRTDLDDYFENSGIREVKSLSHTPCLVFVKSNKDIEVKIVYDPRELLMFPDETKVMSQWREKWRSDFFQFTISDLKKHIEKNPKQSYHKI